MAAIKKTVAAPVQKRKKKQEKKQQQQTTSYGCIKKGSGANKSRTSCMTIFKKTNQAESGAGLSIL